jgi:hypothetical protein
MGNHPVLSFSVYFAVEIGCAIQVDWRCMNRPILFALLVTITSLFLPAVYPRNAACFRRNDLEPAVLRAIIQSNTTIEGKLVYADFEQLQKPGERPVSNRGGLIQFIAYQENTARPSHYQGAPQISPPAPELVRLQKDNPNKAASFDYELQGPNLFAGVGMEVHGQADKDKKLIADDISGYKFLTLQMYVTGVPSLRVEFVSQGQGISIPIGYPQMTVKIESGFNTYRIPLKSVSQPFWAPEKVNPKDLLKKLTSVNLYVHCDNCAASIKGTVVVDNLIFEK